MHRLLLHATSLHSTSASSSRTTSSSLVSSASMARELLLVLSVLRNAGLTTLVWLSSLIWLSRLHLRTNTDVAYTLDDLSEDLVNLSVFLCFPLLLDFFLGKPQFNLHWSRSKYIGAVELSNGSLSIANFLKENKCVLVLRNVLVPNLFDSLVHLDWDDLSSLWESFPNFFFSNVGRYELYIYIGVECLW